MFRKVSALCAGAIAVATLAASPAGAGTASVPVTGSMLCDIAGTITISKPLPNANDPNGGSLKNLHYKLAAKMTNCGAVDLKTPPPSGGKAPITSGTLSVTGILEAGASCNDISFDTPPDISGDPNKFDAKWTGTNGSSHPTVGHSRTNDTEIGNNTLFGGWEYSSGPVRDNDAFAGETATLDLYLANTKAVSDCINGFSTPSGQLINLSTVSFGGPSALSRSTITIAP